jgi:hypothetical protein
LAHRFLAAFDIFVRAEADSTCFFALVSSGLSSRPWPSLPIASGLNHLVARPIVSSPFSLRV